MRRFNSYGPIDTDLHYYAPRKELIAGAFTQLMGENPQKGGHYITVWAPRQTGKTWVMQEVIEKIDQTGQYDIAIITLDRAKNEKEEKEIVSLFIEKLQIAFSRQFPSLKKISEISTLFTAAYFQRPVILLLDEFDALEEEWISRFAGIFRDMFISRTNERKKNSGEKYYLLHGLALIGVRGVLGIENEKGSPFNVQRSVHIPNLTFEEVKGMFQWYEKESGQQIEPAVVEKLYQETAGQPGLTCWLGEILTEGVENLPNGTSRPIQLKDFENLYRLALNVLPNNNILNIISKAKIQPYRYTVIDLFKTDKPMKFRFDDKEINYLYMNGVIGPETITGDDSYVKFASPFVQKRLFNYFSGDIFKEMGQLVDMFYNVREVIFPDHMDIPGMLNLYQTYLDKNKGWLFKDVPRRSDLRIYEAVFHFNLYAYLDELLRGNKVRIIPEFPTGNGKIDLLLQYNNMTCGIELKSFTDQAGYRSALAQAAQYANRLGLKEIYLVSFIESIDDANKKKYETSFRDPGTGVSVHPVFIQTGKL